MRHRLCDSCKSDLGEHVPGNSDRNKLPELLDGCCKCGKQCSRAGVENHQRPSSVMMSAPTTVPYGASCIIVWGGNHRRLDALREAVSRVRPNGPKNAPVASQRDKITVASPWMRPRFLFQDGQGAVLTSVSPTRHHSRKHRTLILKRESYLEGNEQLMAGPIAVLERVRHFL